MHKSICAAFAAAVLIVGSATGFAQAPAPTKVRVTFAPGIQYAALFAGVQKGIFLKHGIDAVLNGLSSGTDVVKALSAGTTEVATLSANSLSSARSVGVNGVMTAIFQGDATASQDDQPVAGIFRKDSGIAAGKWDSLVGKKVGLVRGGTPDRYLVTGLEKAKVDPGKVNMIAVPYGDQLVAFQTKSVDAVFTNEPYQSIILAKVPDAVLFQRGGGLADFKVGPVWTEAYVAANPDTVQRFSDAIAEANQWTRKNLDEAATIATQWTPGLEADVAKTAIKNMRFDPRIGPCTKAAFGLAVKILLDQKKLQKDVPVAEMLVEKFIDKTASAHPEYLSDLAPLPATCS